MTQAPSPFPTPLNAALLTMMGAFFSAAVAALCLDFATPTAAAGIGTVVGLGGAGLLGAANVPPPHAERVGLRLPRARHLAAVLLLVPVALVASEADNVVKLLAPPPDAQEVAKQVVETLPTDTSLALLETLIVGVGLIPVVEEWFFRGVVQQGLVGSLGAAGGVFVTALFFALGHGVSLSVQSWAALVAQTLVLGLVFGYARHKSGSLLAPMLLHVGVNGLGVAALAAPHLIQIPGYNAPGAHTPWWLLALAVTAVAAGVAVLWNETPPPVPVVPATDEGDEFEE